MTSEMKIPAIRVQQSKKKVIFQFTVDGKELPRFAAISRIRRDERREIAGYQRPEARSHIASIRKYIESESPMIPNSLVVAFKRQVKFIPLKGTNVKDKIQMGYLLIPALKSVDDEGEVIGWIVDGQQRSAAIRSAKVKAFPIPVTAFVALNESEQREQFILVNSVKPLAKSLIYELLPTTDAMLPAALARRRLAATVLDALNSDKKSPFFQKIQTPTNPEGKIKDNTILRMLEYSILEGVLYNFRDARTGDGDVSKMCSIVNNFFGAVKERFPDDWELTPRKSRLVHGAGIISMGFLMDQIATRSKKGTVTSKAVFATEIELIATKLRWSSGFWTIPGRGKVQWNDFQNTSKDLSILTSHILDLYAQAKEI
jgi:DGQHR domain-containing protein